MPVSECNTDDWIVNPKAAPDNKASEAIGQPAGNTNLGSGTTAQLPTNLNYLHFPRRVAFKRDTTNNLELMVDNQYLWGFWVLVLVIFTNFLTLVRPILTEQ